MPDFGNFKILQLYHCCFHRARTLRPIMQKVILKRKIAQRIANGHPWIFANEVEKVDGDVAAGDIVEVYFFDGKSILTLLLQTGTTAGGHH